MRKYCVLLFVALATSQLGTMTAHAQLIVERVSISPYSSVTVPSDCACNASSSRISDDSSYWYRPIYQSGGYSSQYVSPPSILYGRTYRAPYPLYSYRGRSSFETILFGSQRSWNRNRNWNNQRYKNRRDNNDHWRRHRR